jgi:Fe-S cluster assembly ATP-binding protein
MSVLDIKDLQVSVETEQGAKQILRGVDLSVKDGEIHAIMGPNGSGKSTLAYTIAGHPKYHVEGGSVTLDGVDLLSLTVDARARAGLFLAMQYPVEIPGVAVSNFLRTAKTALDGEAPAIRGWMKEVKEAMKNLRMDPSFAERSVNEGFSGGEKKRNEILHALKIVAKGVNRAKANTGLGVLLITHYTRILRYIRPDFVHVFVNGRVAERGGPELADKLEDQGYDRYLAESKVG